MALTVHRPTYFKTRKTGLTPLGIALLAGIALLVAAFAGVMLANQFSRRADERAAQPVDSAVSYALTVAGQTARALGTDADVQLVRDTASFIEGESDPTKRAEAAQTLLGEMLSIAQGSQASIDEINGAKNRVHLAVRNYESR